MDHSKRLGIILLLSGLGVFALHLFIASDVNTTTAKECFQLPTAMTKIEC